MRRHPLLLLEEVRGFIAFDRVLATHFDVSRFRIVITTSAFVRRLWEPCEHLPYSPISRLADAHANFLALVYRGVKFI